MVDQRQIAFCPGPKTARVIAAERKRLEKHADGARVSKAQAVRSLIHKAAAIEEQADAVA